ncbi:MAG: alpha/beta hydrolase [Candidatus Nanopelagicales bacterium]
MAMSSRFSALAVAIALLLVGSGCGSSSDSGSGGDDQSGAVTGTVPASFIEDPPADLVKSAGISRAAANAGVALARKLTWQYVQAGGVTQAAACTGSGSPTVVYSNGLLLQAAWTWPVVATEQAKTNRVCMFDRPGTGLSPARPPGAATNGPVANANEMFALLAALNEKGPFVLVGWSYGGMVVRTAAATQPDQTAGMNLIDAVVPTQYRTFDRSGWEEGGTPLDMKAAETAVDGGADLGAKPLVVLEAGQDPGSGSAAQDEWSRVQRASLSISTNAVYGVVPKASHPIPQQSPQSVEAAGLVIMASISAGNPMPSCPPEFGKNGIVCQKA